MARTCTQEVKIATHKIARVAGRGSASSLRCVHAVQAGRNANGGSWKGKYLAQRQNDEVGWRSAYSNSERHAGIRSGKKNHREGKKQSGLDGLQRETVHSNFATSEPIEVSGIPDLSGSVLVYTSHKTRNLVIQQGREGMPVGRKRLARVQGLTSAVLHWPERRSESRRQ
jgi:hypothetical protein